LFQGRSPDADVWYKTFIEERTCWLQRKDAAEVSTVNKDHMSLGYNSWPPDRVVESFKAAGEGFKIPNSKFKKSFNQEQLQSRRA
jgi:hypothetical protein